MTPEGEDIVSNHNPSVHFSIYVYWGFHCGISKPLQHTIPVINGGVFSTRRWPNPLRTFDLSTYMSQTRTNHSIFQPWDAGKYSSFCLSLPLWLAYDHHLWGPGWKSKLQTTKYGHLEGASQGEVAKWTSGIPKEVGPCGSPQKLDITLTRPFFASLRPRSSWSKSCAGVLEAYPSAINQSRWESFQKRRVYSEASVISKSLHPHRQVPRRLAVLDYR